MVQPQYHPVIENLHWEIVMEQSSTECKVHKTVAVGGYGRHAPKNTSALASPIPFEAPVTTMHRFTRSSLSK